MTTFSASQFLSKKKMIARVCSGSFMIFGTTVGAGMLGIPAVTASMGFLPAVVIMVSVWLFMLITGLLLLEVTLRMPSGANIISLSGRFLGVRGQWVVGALFLFLYGCLLVAYFSGGGPLLSEFLSSVGISSCPRWVALLLFSALFGSIILAGARWISRTNFCLSLGMFASYAALLFWGRGEVTGENLSFMSFSPILSAVPILFGAFGFHNVVPSLTNYLQQDKKALRLSIILGTFLAFVFYTAWQWLVLGSVSSEALERVCREGLPVTYALQRGTGIVSVHTVGQIFAFLALTTSFLGVGFSLADFVKDAFHVLGKNISHLRASLLALMGPLVLVLWVPALFEQALGVAGGFGESLLNGVLPVWLFWQMYRCYYDKATSCFWYKIGVFSLMSLGVFVVFLEAKELFFSH